LVQQNKGNVNITKNVRGKLNEFVKQTQPLGATQVTQPLGYTAHACAPQE